MSLPANARLFVAFRVFFNARFYYPVLAVFFLDLGLTLEQYALLNTAWALSIVAIDLPLGALGDQMLIVIGNCDQNRGEAFCLQ